MYGPSHTNNIQMYREHSKLQIKNMGHTDFSACMLNQGCFQLFSLCIFCTWNENVLALTWFWTIYRLKFENRKCQPLAHLKGCFTNRTNFWCVFSTCFHVYRQIFLYFGILGPPFEWYCSENKTNISAVTYNFFQIQNIIIFPHNKYKNFLLTEFVFKISFHLSANCTKRHFLSPHQFHLQNLLSFEKFTYHKYEQLVNWHSLNFKFLWKYEVVQIKVNFFTTEGEFNIFFLENEQGDLFIYFYYLIERTP